MKGRETRGSQAAYCTKRHVCKIELLPVEASNSCQLLWAVTAVVAPLAVSRVLWPPKSAV
jgi:hypothetical protein